MPSVIKLLIPTQMSDDDIEKLLTHALGKNTEIGTVTNKSGVGYELALIPFFFDDEDGVARHRTLQALTIHNPDEFESNEKLGSDGKVLYDGKRTILSLSNNELGVEVMKKIYNAAGGFLYGNVYYDKPDAVKPLTDFFSPEDVRKSIMTHIQTEMNMTLDRVLGECDINAQDGAGIKDVYDSVNDDLMDAVDRIIAERTQKQAVSRDKGSPSP